MKKFLLLLGFTTITTGLFAAPVEPLNSVTRQIAAYLPYVKMLIYILAVLIGMSGGIIVTFMKMQDANAKVKPRIIATVASCIMLISAATALPQFFGYEADGSASDRLVTAPPSGGANIYDSVTGDYIKTEIPGYDSDKWITFPPHLKQHNIYTALSIWENHWKPNITEDQLYRALQDELMVMVGMSVVTPSDVLEINQTFSYIVSFWK